MHIDTKYMERALQLARLGEGLVSPNPMVGAVIVSADGRIIGEGYHHRYGGPHAEVCAVNSVKESDRHLLKDSTIYVTLEPCSHYGKTPPCAAMLVEKGVKRVVVGSPDPNPLVSGRGVRMLREAGIEVEEGVLRQECDALNRRFLTSQLERRPWIQLKWAMSADGFMGDLAEDGKPVPHAYSNPLSKVWMHRERSMADAILVGTATLISDHPSLTLRHWPGHNPRKVSFDSARLTSETPETSADFLLLPPDLPLEESMHRLFEQEGIGSLMVEGGADTLRRFIEAGLYDEIRVETSPTPQHSGIPAPQLPKGLTKISQDIAAGNTIEVWRR